jgi:polysaccharide chain length determinant protein (PEP-CTERM system associated)
MEALVQVRDAATSVWRRRWWALGAAVLAGAAGTAAVMKMPARYEASARVYVDTQSILKPLMSGLAVQPNVDQQLAMMSRTLLSRPNVERVVRMADLDLGTPSQQARESLVDSLMRQIRFSGAGGGSNVYTITYASDRPEAARKVVQSLLSIFVESNLGDKRRDSEQARRFIDEQIAAYEQRLIESENALKDFKIRNMNVMPSLAQDFVARSTEIQQRLTQARMDLREAENGRDSLRQQIQGETPTFALPVERMEATAAAVATAPSELDVRIETLRKSLDGMRSRFTDEHPDVVGTRRILGQLEQQRDAERRAERARMQAAAAQATPAQRMSSNPVFQQLKIALAEAEATVASLRARVGGLESQLAQVRATAQVVPKVEAEFTQLTRDYEINKRNYEQLVTRRESAKLSGDMETSASIAQFRVVDPPQVGSQPVSPNRPVLLAAVLLVSLAVGIAIAFVRDRMAGAFYDAAALRAATGVPMLGTVSLVLDSAARARVRWGHAAFSGSALLYLGSFLALVAWHLLAGRLR